MSRSRRHHWHGGEAPSGRPVVVGVVPGQPPWLVQHAAELAQATGGGLVCVWVDGSRVLVAAESGGTITTTPLDPDQDDDGRRLTAEKEMNRHLKQDLVALDVPWLFVYAVGETARGLTAVADEHDARLIAVGPRRPGIEGWLNQVVGGSVAGRLVHTQHRPVMIIPPPARGSA